MQVKQGATLGHSTLDPYATSILRPHLRFFDLLKSVNLLSFRLRVVKRKKKPRCWTLQTILRSSDPSQFWVHKIDRIYKADTDPIKYEPIN